MLQVTKIVSRKPSREPLAIAAVYVTLTMLVWGLFAFDRGTFWDEVYALQPIQSRSGNPLGQLFTPVPSLTTRWLGGIPYAFAEWSGRPVVVLQFLYGLSWLSMGVSGCHVISASIDEPGLENKVGKFDVVHCSGLLYHCPNPLHALSQLARISREYLILTTTAMPETVTNWKGTITIPPGTALFVPFLRHYQAEILKEYWEAGGVAAIGITEQPQVWHVEDYGPWWWLFPVPTVRQLIMAAGFGVLEDWPYWGGKAHSFLAVSENSLPLA